MSHMKRTCYVEQYGRRGCLKHWPFLDVDELLNLLRQGPVPWEHPNLPPCTARMADVAPTTWVSLLVTTIW